MPRIAFCIPSYRRAGKVRTLDICPRARVYVDPSEAEEYGDGNPTAEIVAMPEGVQGNIARVRNFILDHEFGAGAGAVCMMDDDLASFGTFRGNDDGFGYERCRIHGEEFEEFVIRGTELCDDLGLKLWGVNLQYSNRMYHQSVPFSITHAILGPFCVHIDNPIRYDETIPLKEDYDIFLQHMDRNRGVLRMNMAWYENGGSNTAKGGCATTRSMRNERIQFNRLRQKWGGGIVRRDGGSKKRYDFNPIVKVPIEGA